MAERAFQTQLIRFGAGGLNIRPQKDVVPPNDLPVMTNAIRLRNGSITTRPGQTAITTAPGGRTRIHSIARLADVLAATVTRIWGIDTFLYYGASGALTLAESGFSGDPLTMIAADPPIPGTPWMYIADRTKMRKVRSDGLDLEIGLPPGSLLSTTVGTTVLENAIEPFDAVTGFTGYSDPFDPSAGVPTFALVTDPLGAPANAFEVTTDPGTDIAEYSNFLDKSIGPLDLSQYPAVTPAVPATDDDFMHLWLQPDANVTGVLIYLTSGTFTPGNVPGTVIGTNDHAARCVINFSPAQVGIWNEFGTIAIPLRRADFNLSGMLPWVQPIDWANVTGLSIRVLVGSAVPATLSFWDFTEISTRSASGGVSAVPYDYRVTNYDPRTGVEGNPSPVSPEANWISDLGTYVTITPNPYGDAAVRQRAYRRGGTLPDNWYFVGENTADGGPIYDSATDASIAASPTVEINHDQPVTSIDNTTGATLLATPIPIIFGPIQGLFFGLGDPHRPSTVYWTLPDQPDYWPAIFTYPVCATAEPLQTGCVWGGEGYVASAARWFRLIPNLSDAANVTAQPSGATKGVVSRWAMCVGPDGVHYVSDDGWYRHTGGPQENLTDEKLYPIFNGMVAPGWAGAPDLQPIDFAHPELIRMTSVLNEVWLLYQDVGGTMQCLILDTQAKTFRNATFGPVLGTGVPPAVVVGELETGASVENPPKLLLFGGRDTAVGYSHTGQDDAGGFIDVRVLTACLDQSAPRNRKQYGDAVLKWTSEQAPVGIEAWLDDAAVQTAVGLVSLLPPGAAPTQRAVDLFGPDPLEGRNVAIALSWVTDATHAPPIIDYAGVSYFVQPDETVDRISDWDDGGAQGEKYLKGCVIDVDTGGVDKAIDVQATLYDGTVTTVASLIVNTNGRRKLTFTWPRQAVSFMRLSPTDAIPWTRWAWQWIFDEEPLALTRWETEPEDFALVGWKTITQMYLTLRTTAPVTLTVTAFYDNGMGSVVETYPIPSTGGVKQSRWVTFRAGKGVLYSFVFTADDGSRWRLYREETTLVVQPLPGNAVVRHPFGNDDNDLVRGLQSSEGTALAPGGGEG